MRACAETPSNRVARFTSSRDQLVVSATGRPSHLPALLAAVLVIFAVAMLCVGSATAAPNRAYTGISFGPDGVGGSKSFSDVQSIAVDQISGEVFVYDIVNSFSPEGKLYKFSASGSPVDFPASGENSITVPGTATEKGAEQIAIAPTNSPAGTAGDIYVANNANVEVFSPTGAELGTLGEGETCGVAVDPAGQIFVGSYDRSIREYTPTSPVAYTQTGEAVVEIELCNVAADATGNVYASNYAGEKTAKLKGIADTTPTLIEPGGATLAADPVSSELFLDQKDHVSVYDSGGTPAGEIGSGELTQSYGVAVRSSTEWVYASDQASGTVKVFVPRYPTTEPATGVTTEAATLHGTVRPEGRPYTDCRFEYGLISVAGFEKSINCEPEASEIPVGSSSFAVTRSLGGLQSNSDYKFRLVVTNSAGTINGEALTFSTVGPPRFMEIIARDADQESATLEATVDPRGADASYRIEWGSTSAYGNVAGTGTVPAGAGQRAISARVTGLSPATTYHFRIVAESTEGGETASPDQLFETLNACGFTDGRCLELVSPADKGPIASPGRKNALGLTLQFQAAAGGSALAYAVESGYPETTAGTVSALYQGRRGPTGWASEQLTPPALEPSNPNSQFEALSSDLACGVVASPAPLAAGAPLAVVEAGFMNLYRRANNNGSYQLITDLPPVDPPSREEREYGLRVAEYRVVGMSSDCRRVIFRTSFLRYPGIPAASAVHQLYEWDDGTLHNVAVIPGPGGTAEPVPAESLPGALDESPGFGAIDNKDLTDYWRSVSADGIQTIFTAVSRFGGDAGGRAVFLRDAADPSVRTGTVPATDISQSETSTSNDGNSRYWTSSADGSRVFFTARYGLAANGSSAGAANCFNAPFGGAAESSGEGCDLYEYDVDAPAGGHLTDLSPDSTDREGAGVVGVLDASEDGSYVYFAARGRLGGAGETEAENVSASTYNVYLAHGGTISFVHTIGQTEAIGPEESATALVSTGAERRHWTSRSAVEGRSFAFESSLGTPNGVRMVYLYSAADDVTVCVSCRRDGRSPFSETSLRPLVDVKVTSPHNAIIQPTVLTNNGRLYFYSFDSLATGAIEGDRNLYQWEHGQVSLIASESTNVPHNEQGGPIEAFYAGASADGGDVYFATPQRLAGGAEEGWNVYDARVGGGFPDPVRVAPQCNSAIEGACNVGVAPPSPSGSPPTTSFGGPGNPPAAHHKKVHRRKKHQQKHKRHKRKHHAKDGTARRTHNDRGANK